MPSRPLLEWATVIIVFVAARAGAKGQLVPAGVQNFMESVVDFVRNGVILETMGPEGLPWTPFLFTLFCFVFVGNTIVSDDTQRSAFNFSYNLAHAATAFVGDSSVFGFLSPVRGTRYRYEVQALTGDLKFQTALADWRKYFFFNPVTFAMRGIYYGRYGTDSESGKISPLYIGQDALIHGYNVGSISASECVRTPGSNACPVFDRLIGSKIAVANLEVRVPVIGTKQFGLASGFVPTEFFAFLDSGAAWSSNQHLDVRFARNNATDRVPVVSAGAGLRLLLAYIPLEFYAAKPFQRPTQGWVTGFNIITGW